MIAFRLLLSPKVKFVWTEELAKAFVLAKVIISRKIHKGVRMFKVLRVMSFVTHWALEGQSLGLWQKHCDCEGPVTIVCCRGGWRILFMSSRYNNYAQLRHSAI